MLAADTISSTRATWWNRTSGSAPLRTIVFAYYMHAIPAGTNTASTPKKTSLLLILRKYFFRESNKVVIFNSTLCRTAFSININCAVYEEIEKVLSVWTHSYKVQNLAYTCISQVDFDFQLQLSVIRDVYLTYWDWITKNCHWSLHVDVKDEELISFPTKPCAI